MFPKSLLLTLLLFAILLDGCSPGKQHDSIYVHRSGDECIRTYQDSLTDSNILIDPHCDCGSSDFGVVQTIPYCAADACGTTHVDLSSACVRCAMCVAIAEKINRTLLEVHEMISSWLNDTEITLLLRTVCDHSFQHYNLREIDGQRFITDPSPGDRLIVSSADELWNKNLRNMCHEYLDEIQELHLYENWKRACEENEHVLDLENILCRNEINNLRDCRGINSIPKRHVPSKFFGTRVKVLAEYNNCR